MCEGIELNRLVISHLSIYHSFAKTSNISCCWAGDAGCGVHVVRVVDWLKAAPVRARALISWAASIVGLMNENGQPWAALYTAVL
jgi:hypothetical protein